MPAGDKTGPQGFGPMTGRGMGYCAGYPTPGYMQPGFGRGAGRGPGRGMARGFRGGRGTWGYGYQYNPAPYWEPAAPTKEEELSMLKAQSEQFKRGLEDIQKRISELENESSNNTA